MRRLSDMFRDFRRDERGVFAVLFSLIAVVLIAFAGSAVDFTLLQQRRTTAQVALDAAALALQSKINTMAPDAIGQRALTLVRDRMNDPQVTVEITGVEIDKSAGSLRLTASFDAPSYFVTLVGVHRLGAAVRSQATRKSQRIEIAMVLDNSGSMETANRMVYLRQAATNATRIFFADSTPGDPRIFVGLVPFTQYVNIDPRNANAAWIDRAGRSPISGDNFQLDPNSPLARYDRIALFETMAVERWRGCVEARVFPYDTDDTPPEYWRPETLFTPLFAPDEPDHRNWLGQYLFNNHYLTDQRGRCEAPPRWQTWSDRTLQERMCKYQGATLTRPASMQQARGPNADCPTNPITPLTSTQKTVVDGIAAMYPQGGTNIAQGAVWGLHMLTPGLPLQEGANYDQSVTKVMIVMTDGDNFHSADNNMNGATFYTAYGYPYNRRLGKPGDSTATLQRLMDERLLATCKSAKDLGIKIYTIGLSMTSRSTEEMLEKCSSGEGYAFLPEKPTELNAIFEKIADQLSVLRISQ